MSATLVALEARCSSPCTCGSSADRRLRNIKRSNTGGRLRFWEKKNPESSFDKPWKGAQHLRKIYDCAVTVASLWAINEGRAPSSCLFAIFFTKFRRGPYGSPAWMNSGMFSLGMFYMLVLVFLNFLILYVPLSPVPQQVPQVTE